MTDEERLARIDELARRLVYLKAGVEIPDPPLMSFSASQEE